MLDLSAIRAAAETIRGRARRTELIHSHYFSARLGTPLYFKCENLQRTCSFKIRGAYNFLFHQSEEARRRGVITASAGNHAQGVAFAATEFGIPALVVMPENTPLAKVLATREYGAEVVMYGTSFDAAAERARQLEAERKMLFVPAFDHPLVMAGQGTVDLEIPVTTCSHLTLPKYVAPASKNAKEPATHPTSSLSLFPSFPSHPCRYRKIR